MLPDVVSADCENLSNRPDAPGDREQVQKHVTWVRLAILVLDATRIAPANLWRPQPTSLTTNHVVTIKADVEREHCCSKGTHLYRVLYKLL